MCELQLPECSAVVMQTKILEVKVHTFGWLSSCRNLMHETSCAKLFCIWKNIFDCCEIYLIVAKCMKWPWRQSHGEVGKNFKHAHMRLL